MSGDPAAGWSFDPTWRSFSAIQGGMIVGSLLRAVRGAVIDRSGRQSVVRSATAHFLEPVIPDVVVLPSVRLNRLGATSSVHAEAWQQESLRAVVQVLVTSAPGEPEPSAADPGTDLPPGFQSPDAAEPMTLSADFVPFTSHLEFRAVGPARPLAGGSEPRLTAWVRLRDTTAVPGPLVQLGVIVDALPPSLYATATKPAALPTVELTVHLLRSVPSVGEWLRVDQWTSWSDAHVCVDDANLHDEQGRLVARSRQTRRVLRR